MKVFLKIFFLWNIFFFAATPRAHAVLKTAPNFSTETENIVTKFEKKSVHKPNRIERWLLRKAEKQMRRLKNSKFKKHLPTDLPDDDEPAEPFRVENVADARTRNFLRAGKYSKWGLGLLFGAFLVFVGFLFDSLFSSSEDDGTFTLVFLMTLAGVALTLYSFYAEGFNWCNSLVLFFFLLALI
jgi:hypothetical protein